MSIYHLHDKTFRSVMKDIQVAMEFFQNYLPDNIRSCVDLKTLKLRDNTYIDPVLRECQSDILYEVNINDTPGFLYLLLEHMSTAKELTPFSIWQYKIGIWSDYIKEKKRQISKLPLIVPMVFYNGTEPYDKPRNLNKIIDGSPEVINAVLYKDFHLIDTNTIEDETLKEQLWSGIVTFAFKHSRNREFKNAFLEFCKRAKILVDKEGSRAVPLIKLLLHYQSLTKGLKDPKEILDIVEAELINPDNGENVMMSFAEYFEGIGVEKGRQEGRQVGHQEGESALLLRLLQRKFGIIPAHYRNKIEQADANTLLTWGERILKADYIEEIFEEKVPA